MDSIIRKNAYELGIALSSLKAKEEKSYMNTFENFDYEKETDIICPVTQQKILTDNNMLSDGPRKVINDFYIIYRRKVNYDGLLTMKFYNILSILGLFILCDIAILLSVWYLTNFNAKYISTNILGLGSVMSINLDVVVIYITLSLALIYLLINIGIKIYKLVIDRYYLTQFLEIIMSASPSELADISKHIQTLDEIIADVKDADMLTAFGIPVVYDPSCTSLVNIYAFDYYRVINYYMYIIKKRDFLIENEFKKE